MRYFYKLFWKQKLTWVLVAALLILVVGQSYFNTYRLFISFGDFFTGSAIDAGEVYEANFFFRGAALMHIPLYALWIYGITRFSMDIKFSTRNESRSRWMLLYLRLSLPLAATFLLILNIPALIGSYLVGGVFLPVLPYYLYSFVLELILHMIFSLIYFLAYLLTDRPIVPFIALLLYGALESWYGAINFNRYGEEFNVDLTIGWGRAITDSTLWTEDHMLDWSAFFVLAVIFLLFFVLCQIAVHRKDFLSTQENAQKA